MIAITFALPDESRDLIAALHHAGSNGLAVLGNIGTHEVAVFHTGMGSERVRQRLPEFLKNHAVSGVISAGYAGGLDPSLAAGSLLIAENCSDPAWAAAAREQLNCAEGKLETSQIVVETVAAKAAFARETGAAAVDMETAHIAAICREHQLPLLSLRVITDPAEVELAVPFSVCFDAKTETPRVGALLRHLLRHPSRIGPFTRFIVGVTQARAHLTEALITLINSPTEGGMPKRPGR